MTTQEFSKWTKLIAHTNRDSTTIIITCHDEWLDNKLHSPPSTSYCLSNHNPIHHFQITLPPLPVHDPTHIWQQQRTPPYLYTNTFTCWQHTANTCFGRISPTLGLTTPPAWMDAIGIHVPSQSDVNMQYLPHDICNGTSNQALRATCPLPLPSRSHESPSTPGCVSIFLLVLHMYNSSSCLALCKCANAVELEGDVKQNLRRFGFSQPYPHSGTSQLTTMVITG